MPLTTGLATIEGQIRWEIADTREAPNGARPEGLNFDSATIQHYYTAEGGNWAGTPSTYAVKRTAAALFELMATEWARYPSAEKIGPYSRTSKPTWQYCKEKAQSLRDAYGYGNPELAALARQRRALGGGVKAVRNRE